MFDRVMVALALLFALEASSVAQGTHPAGRIAATLYPAQGAARGSKAAAALPDNVQGPFKADPEAPIHIEADRLVEIFDGTKQAVFSGNVKLQQGDFQLRTIATADWATFDVMANTVLMGDRVVVSWGKDVATGPRLKIDLTTGMYRFVEIESTPASPQPPAAQIRSVMCTLGPNPPPPSDERSSLEAPSRSRIGHGMLEALYGARAKADELSGLEYACTLGEFATCGLEFLGVGVGTAQTLPNLASLAGEVTVAGDGISGTG